jgi:hypothetical protein
MTIRYGQPNWTLFSSARRVMGSAAAECPESNGIKEMRPKNPSVRKGERIRSLAQENPLTIELASFHSAQTKLLVFRIFPSRAYRLQGDPVGFGAKLFCLYSVNYRT